MSQKITFADVLKAADALFDGDKWTTCNQAIYEWNMLAKLAHRSDTCPILESMGLFLTHKPKRDQTYCERHNLTPYPDTMPTEFNQGAKAPSNLGPTDAHYTGKPGTKPTNPKDAIGSSKPPLSCVSMPVMFEVGAAMLEGSCKYGRHNYRVAGVRSSVYFDAAMRHLARWWEGEDIDPDSGMSHITKCIAGLAVLRDAQINGMVAFDDRPPKAAFDWYANAESDTKEILGKYPNPIAPNTETKQ
jgi:hypothetical protein